MTRPIISIEGLVKSFGGLPVLRGVDLSVAAGEVLAVIGPSGSGKSTLLRCVNGLTWPDAGRVVVDGHQLTPKTARLLRREVGMVFQHFELFPHRTALENIMEGPRYVLGIDESEARARAMELLGRVGLAAKAASYPSSLSGGQQQRIAIARALAMRPKAMLFDEATSALDPETVGEVLGVMRDLAGEGTTMLVVTHEMSFARDVAHRVAFLDGGAVAALGRPEEIFGRPEDPRLRAFLGRVEG